MTIRTVTLNTGFDEVVIVRDVIFGGVSEIVDRRVYASGKGINAARLLGALGHEVIAYGLIGRQERARFSELLDQAGIGDRLVAVADDTRRNLTLLPREDGRPAAHLKAEGYTRASQDDVEELLRLVRDDVRPGDLVSLHGSVPAGIAPDVWRRLADAARAAGASVAIDVHGSSLAMVLNGSSVRACKPNEHEVLELPDMPSVDGAGGVALALRSMFRHGVTLPIVSMEHRGAAFLEDDRPCRIWRQARPVSMLVGAGDAFMAGLLSAFASGADDLAALRRATACASLHVEGYESREIADRLFSALHDVQTAAL